MIFFGAFLDFRDYSRHFSAPLYPLVSPLISAAMRWTILTQCNLCHLKQEIFCLQAPPKPSQSH